MSLCFLLIYSYELISIVLVFVTYHNLSIYQVKLLIHLFHCVFMGLITHVKSTLQTQRFTTQPVKELRADGWTERQRVSEKKKESKTD